MGRNAEGYKDPTAAEAIGNVAKEAHRREVERLAVISGIMEIIRKMAGLVGYEVVGRIVLKDKITGKEYK